MTAEACESTGCDKPKSARGLCQKHYKRAIYTGEMKPKRVHYSSHEESFAARTEPGSDGCVVWTAAKSKHGYGQLQVDGKRVEAHRYAWERANGPIPSGMQVDHLCWTPACVNVEHLRLVTLAQNAQNRKGAQANSKSGIRGVSRDFRSGKWRVHAQLNGRSIYGGVYPTVEEAEQVAIALRSELFTHSTK